MNLKEIVLKYAVAIGDFIRSKDREREWKNFYVRVNEVENTLEPLIFLSRTLILSATESDGLLINRSEHSSQIGPQTKALSRPGN
jgi:hypothetical protein